MINEYKKNSENGNLLTKTEQIGNNVEAEIGAEIIKLVEERARGILENTSDTSEIIKEANEVKVNDENWSPIKGQIKEWIKAIGEALKSLNKYRDNIKNSQDLEERLVGRKNQLLELILGKELRDFEQDRITLLGGDDRKKYEKYVEKYAEKMLEIFTEVLENSFEIKEVLKGGSKLTLEHIFYMLEDISETIKKEAEEEKMSSGDWCNGKYQIKHWIGGADISLILLNKYMDKYGKYVDLQNLQAQLQGAKKYLKTMESTAQLIIQLIEKGQNKKTEISTTNKGDYFNMYV